MIISVCLDDSSTLKNARKAANKYPNVFGTSFQAYDQPINNLGKNENLFIFAHGTDDDAEAGEPVIGDMAEDFYVSGSDFWANIEPIFPKGYSGSIYIWACYSADANDRLGKSFTDFLKSTIENALGTDIEVYGQHGEVDANVRLPGDKSWIAATG